MPVVGIFAQTDIRHHHHFGNVPFNRPDRLLNDPVIGKVLQPKRIFLRRDAEQNHGRDSQAESGFRFAHGFIDRQLGNSRHRADLRPPGAVPHEQRIDEITGIQFRFAHHRAQAGRSPQTARAGN
jgi:hypothetical protein